MLKSKNLLIVVAVVFIGAIAVLIGPEARADVVFVSGDVSGVWSADSVIVVDSVRVLPGESLMIMPGVDVLFTSYYKFEILDEAVLNASGTESDSIKFLPFTQGDRTLGLDFINVSDQSILEYCYISDAITTAIHLENSSITVRNCLIENSQAGSGSEGGGALEILSNSNPLIENCLLRDNNSVDYGGAIYCAASSPEIRSNIIENNLGGYALNCGGGAIACFDQSSPSIIGNVIRNNTVHASGSFSMGHGKGGALFVSGGSNAEISGNIITGNLVVTSPQTTSDGGAIFIAGADPVISNNVIAGNEAQGDNGGAIYLSQSSSMITNNVFYNNAAGDSGGGLYMSQFNSAFITNSIIYGNEAQFGPQIYQNNSDLTVTYSNIQGSWDGEGNIDIDPLFRDPVGGDFHLQAQMCGDLNDSPCIDAGSPDYVDIMLDCDGGLGTELSDMGAYGGQGIPTGVRDDEMRFIPEVFTLSQNYPNPFNTSTVLSFELTKQSFVTLEVYDVLGRKVEALENNRPYPAGEHRVTWDGSQNSSGVYFYRLRVGGHSRTSKMLLIK